MCEVCGQAVVDSTKLPPEIQEKVYRPREDEQYNYELTIESNEAFGDGKGQADAEIEI